VDDRFSGYVHNLGLFSAALRPIQKRETVMADIHIRSVSDELYRALKVRAAEQGITLKALLLPALEALVSTKPVKK
jgi:hypothetical protein